MQAANSNVSTAWRRSHAITAKWEGGWSDHRNDPGGKTMYGVTEARYHAWLHKHGKTRRPVRQITRAEAEQIFYEEYWLRARCNTLFPGVDLATYDASVNSGVSRGRKWLLASLDPQNRHDRTVRKLCAKRLGFVQSLTSLWKDFGRGWSNRIADIEANGVAWALKAMNDDHVVIEQLEDYASEAKKKASTQKKAGTASGTAGGTSGAGLAVDPGSADQLAGMILGGVLVLGRAVAAFLVIRSIIHSRRAAAYRRVAGGIA